MSTTAKSAQETKDEMNPISAITSGLSSIQQAGTGKTGFERLQGIGNIIGLLATII